MEGGALLWCVTRACEAGNSIGNKQVAIVPVRGRGKAATAGSETGQEHAGGELDAAAGAEVCRKGPFRST